MKVKLGIQGLQEAQAANNKAIAALQPKGALGRAIKYATIAAQRWVVAHTHVWHYKGGGLRASHRMAIYEEARAVWGELTIDPTAKNPRGQRPAIYGPIEHARGGSHAFYARAEDEAGMRIAQGAAEILYGGLP